MKFVVLEMPDEVEDDDIRLVMDVLYAFQKRINNDFSTNAVAARVFVGSKYTSL